MRSLTTVAGLIALLNAAPAGAQTERTDAELWSKIDAAMSSFHQISYTLVKQERLRPDEELLPAETFAVKLRKPFDIYMDVIGGPFTGRHILYRSGWDSLKVHVFSRAFQWLVPKIPPISPRALEGNHHPITEAAFDNTIAIIKRNLAANARRRQADPTHPAIQIDPMTEVVEDGVPCYYYRSVNPEIYDTYTVTAEDKDLFGVARKLGNQGYILVYYNADKVKSYDDIHAGQKLRVPVYYGKVSEFWIDKKTLIMTHIKITDFFGKTYEEYRHRDIKLDAAAGLTDRDFDPANPDYGF